jgi:acetophenone carboxylase
VLDSNVEELLAETSDDLPTNFEEITNEQPMEGNHVNMSQTQTLKEYSNADVMTVWMSSGGGYGDVLERDPEAVMDDLYKGTLTHETARELYRVVYDEEGHEVDEAATAKRRDRERVRRLEEAEPFEEFVEEWSEKRPKEELLEYYGEWPIPRIEGGAS